MTTTPSGGARGLTVTPPRAVPGARVEISGAHFPMPADGLPHVLIGAADARVVSASPRTLRVVVPQDGDAGTGQLQPVYIDELPGASGRLHLAKTIATAVHQVDSPVFDRAGRLYLTHSGSRDSRPDVPLVRVAWHGPDAEPTATELTLEIGNPTSTTIGPDGLLYVSSRFEGHVYRVLADDRAERYASDLGVATGLAFSPDGDLFVGDRSGTIFRVRADKQVENWATLPASVAAFHLAFGPDGCLYVTAPTLATHDALYRITPDRLIDVVTDRLGRPQGLAFDRAGDLYVADALAGAAGLFRVDVRQDRPVPELVVAVPAIVGVAFDAADRVIIASSDTVWKLDGMLTAPLENS